MSILGNSKEQSAAHPFSSRKSQFLLLETGAGASFCKHIVGFTYRRGVKDTLIVLG